MDTASALVDQRMLDELTLIASQAATAILSVHSSDLRTRNKADHSPVTAADEASEEIILSGLARLLPGAAIVSEEAAARPAPATLGNQFFLVDPLDGTREFIAGDVEYTINIALIENGQPVVGIVAAPELRTLWRGAVGRAAQRMKLEPGGAVAAAELSAICTRAKPVGRLVAMTSRSHPDPATSAYLDQLPDVQRTPCGSSLKFCRIAEGAADIYPRLTSLSEWDIAAGHALVAAAGGTVTTIDGQAVTYGRPGFRAPPFIAWGQAPG